MSYPPMLHDFSGDAYRCRNGCGLTVNSRPDYPPECPGPPKRSSVSERRSGVERRSKYYRRGYSTRKILPGESHEPGRRSGLDRRQGPHSTEGGDDPSPAGEDEYTVEQMLELDRGEDFLPTGEMRCTLCGRVPCRCGVPRHFAHAFDQILARLRTRPASVGEDDTEDAPCPTCGHLDGYDEVWVERDDGTSALIYVEQSRTRSEAVEPTPVAFRVDSKPITIPGAVWRPLSYFEYRVDAERLVRERLDYGPTHRIVPLYEAMATEATEGSVESTTRMTDQTETGSAQVRAPSAHSEWTRVDGWAIEDGNPDYGYRTFFYNDERMAPRASVRATLILHVGGLAYRVESIDQPDDVADSPVHDRATDPALTDSDDNE